MSRTVFYSYDFYIGVLHPIAHTLSRLLEEPSLATTLQSVYFIFYIFLPLHVSALAGHLQAEYTNILCIHVSALADHLRAEYTIILCIHVSALAGHLQEEYKIILRISPEDGQQKPKHVTSKNIYVIYIKYKRNALSCCDGRFF
jgi:hypothetical protein